MEQLFIEGEDEPDELSLAILVWWILWVLSIFTHKLNITHAIACVIIGSWWSWLPDAAVAVAVARVLQLG